MLTSKLTVSELINKVAAGKAYLRDQEIEKDSETYKRNAAGLERLIKQLTKLGIPHEPSEYAPLVVKNDPYYRFGMPNKEYLKTLGITENNIYVPYKFDESSKLIDLMKERGEL